MGGMRRGPRLDRLRAARRCQLAVSLQRLDGRRMAGSCVEPVAGWIRRWLGGRRFGAVGWHEPGTDPKPKPRNPTPKL